MIVLYSACNIKVIRERDGKDAEEKITLTVVARLGERPCHHGHKIGDSFDYDSQRENLCPMVTHTAFPHVEILKCGGKLPLSSAGDMRFCCSDADVVNVFKITMEEGT